MTRTDSQDGTCHPVSNPFPSRFYALGLSLSCGKAPGPGLVCIISVWVGCFLMVGPVLCAVGCLAVSLAFTPTTKTAKSISKHVPRGQTHDLGKGHPEISNQDQKWGRRLGLSCTKAGRLPKGEDWRPGLEVVSILCSIRKERGYSLELPSRHLCHTNCRRWRQGACGW